MRRRAQARASDRQVLCALFGLLCYTLALCLLRLEPRPAPALDDFQASSLFPAHLA